MEIGDYNATKTGQYFFIYIASATIKMSPNAL